ncbi:uncharacterized protein ASPGLDRAFT_48709 [Aspergillus glaucus CBS 516.65]|uniref:Uncharacterized protein n=1 Tax=Aspergillus glaucus CBS 516.65 TaxID=1160497 RepID=A0A1L9VF82_ASPGL|nr:hypothetical protein ASPGLDRAFT_48709 [Aspergillus glaucus CBS 516.65]OJJ82611.1 hypothetical protein ASPGLDRAFT_48709 [Aspergillus glaucus CBS 516.65]
MSSPIQILARNLHAAATAPSEDGEGVYLVHEDEGSLSQQLWVDNEPGMNTFITEGIKANTPVLYLVNQNEVNLFAMSIPRPEALILLFF